MIDEETPMSFEEIDKKMLAQLIELSKQPLPPVIMMEKCQELMLGTIREILRTLAAVHPNYEKKKILS